MPLDPRGVGKGESWLAGPGPGGSSTQTAEQDSNPGLGVCPVAHGLAKTLKEPACLSSW